jgi:hypothetical protein
VVSELHRFSVSCIFTFAFETCYGLAAFHDWVHHDDEDRIVNSWRTLQLL